MKSKAAPQDKKQAFRKWRLPFQTTGNIRHPEIGVSHCKINKNKYKKVSGAIKKWDRGTEKPKKTARNEKNKFFFEKNLDIS